MLANSFFFRSTSASASATSVVCCTTSAGEAAPNRLRKPLCCSSCSMTANSVKSLVLPRQHLPQVRGQAGVLPLCFPQHVREIEHPVCICRVLRICVVVARLVV